jgi:hypothetical protein
VPFRSLRTALTGTAAACLLLTAAPARAAAAPPAPDPQPAVDLAAAYLASAAYADESAALRDGYAPIPHCLADPGGAGAMGYHYMKESLMGSTDPARPGALLYSAERGPDGKRRLLGLEWLVPDADQDLGTDGDRPSMFGVPFDGPMPGHSPGMPVHYDLHAWTHEANPDGVFKPWNPAVACPPGTTPPPAAHH